MNIVKKIAMPNTDLSNMRIRGADVFESSLDACRLGGVDMGMADKTKRPVGRLFGCCLAASRFLYQASFLGDFYLLIDPVIDFAFKPSATAVEVILWREFATSDLLVNEAAAKSDFVADLFQGYESFVHPDCLRY